MIQPLSAGKYLIRNKRRSASMMLSIAVSILLVLVMQMVFNAVKESVRLAYTGRLEHMTVVYPGENGRISENILIDIRNSPDIGLRLPMLSMTTDYYHFFGNLNIPVYLVDQKQLPAALDQLRLHLTEGRLPEQGTDEIILDRRTANNKGLQVGDFVGRAVDSSERMPGNHQVVGIVEGDCLIGFGTMAQEQLSEANGLLLFGDDLEKANKIFRNAAKEDVWVQIKEFGVQELQEDMQMMRTISSIIVGVVLFIMSFAAGNLSYAQYFARRYEFGTLQAMGYSRSAILLKGAREILLMNAAALVLGVCLVLVSASALQTFLFEPKGYPFVFMHRDGFLQAIIIPAFTVMFSLIPAWWVLSKVDPLTVVEQFE